MRARRNGVLLMPAAALVVHQVRYSLAYGGRASTELAAQGHAYLHSVVPWTVLALGVGASMFLRRVARTAQTGSSGTFTRQSASALWAMTTAALIVIYVLQETLEALRVSGHPAGAAGVFGHGGWWAIPVAAVVALGVVALLRLGGIVLRLASRLATSRARRRSLSMRLPRSIALLVPAPLALARAGRAPPRLNG
jgi:hypothetical protein